MEAEPRASTPPPSAAAPRSTAAFAAALVFALAAAAAASYLWHELSDLKAERRAREQAELDSASAERATLARELEQQREVQAELAARSAVLERELAALRDQSSRGRDALLLADARQLLRYANESLHIARDPERAAAALALADARLAEAGDARHAEVRAALARERAALTRLPRVDVAGMTLALSRITEQVARMPLRVRIPGPEPVAPAPAADAPGSAWDHVVARIKSAFKRFVTVRRAEGPVEALLPPSEEYFLRRNLELKLETARRAAHDRDAVVFRASARVARDWMALHFDPAQPMVREAVRDLDGMLRVELAPPLPDISTSLTLLERIGTGR
jgi:uroporphyrin-3 C-methyltransferase